MSAEDLHQDDVSHNVTRLLRRLADDLAAMPSLRIVAGRYVDMFPHTEHAEVIVRLRRIAPGEEGLS